MLITELEEALKIADTEQVRAAMGEAIARGMWKSFLMKREELANIDERGAGPQAFQEVVATNITALLGLAQDAIKESADTREHLKACEECPIRTLFREQQGLVCSDV